MKNADDVIRSRIRIGYDGTVYKTYTSPDKEERYANEIRVLQELEARGCDFVPKLLAEDPSTLTITTTNCGAPARKISKEKRERIFTVLKEEFGVTHNIPEHQCVCYDPHRGKFCITDLADAEILGAPVTTKSANSLDWFGTSKSGTRKTDNEDSLLVFSNRAGLPHQESMDGHRILQDGCLVFAVSDGMGGHAGGAIASHLVVSHLNQFLPAKIGEENRIGSPAALIEESIHALHKHILRIASSRPEIDDMGATVVCAIFCENQLHFGHVGDSRLYRFRDGHLRQLTDDHSFVGRLQQEGKISEQEARLNPRRNILTQAIGAQCELIYPEVESLRVDSGDWFLICSDGVMDGLWNKHIEQEFLMAGLTGNTPKIVANNLLERAYREAGRDDTTLFVIKAN